MKKRESKYDHEFEDKQGVSPKELKKIRQEERFKQAMKASPMMRRASVTSLARKSSIVSIGDSQGSEA